MGGATMEQEIQYELETTLLELGWSLDEINSVLRENERNELSP